jgi:hypothetical protein
MLGAPTHRFLKIVFDAGAEEPAGFDAVLEVTLHPASEVFWETAHVLKRFGDETGVTLASVLVRHVDDPTPPVSPRIHVSRCSGVPIALCVRRLRNSERAESPHGVEGQGASNGML